MRYWALLLQGSRDDYRLRYLFTWDRVSDRVLGVYELSRDEEIDWVGMSWLGSFVIIAMPVILLPAAALLAVASGLIAGLAPARRAAEMEPVEAMRTTG